MIQRAALLLALLAPAAQADVLDDVADRGAIRLGHRADAPPFSFREAGAPAGLAVRLCEVAAEEIAAALGLAALPVEWVEVSARDRFDALRDGRIDLLCGPTTQTLTRRETLDFSIPYFIDGMSGVFRAGPGAEIGSLGSESVGVLQGTTTAALLPALLAREGAGEAEIVGYETHVDGLEALAAGEIAAYFGDQAILSFQLGRLRPKTPLVFAPGQFSFEPYALTMRRGETRLRLVVDRALSRAFASGRIETMVEESLGAAPRSELARAVHAVVALPE